MNIISARRRNRQLESLAKESEVVIHQISTIAKRAIEMYELVYQSTHEFQCLARTAVLFEHITDGSVNMARYFGDDPAWERWDRRERISNPLKALNERVPAGFYPGRNEAFNWILDETERITLDTQEAWARFESLGAVISEMLSASNVSPSEARTSGLMVGIASWLAAGIRPQARAEWAAEIIAAQSGELQSRRDRQQFAAGLIRAAVSIRLAHIARPFLTVFDAVADSPSRTAWCVAVAVSSMATYIFRDHGLSAVIGDGESLFALGSGIYALLAWRRKVLKDRGSQD